MFVLVCELCTLAFFMIYNYIQFCAFECVYICIHIYAFCVPALGSICNSEY